MRNYVVTRSGEQFEASDWRAAVDVADGLEGLSKLENNADFLPEQIVIDGDIKFSGLALERIRAKARSVARMDVWHS